MMIVKFGPFQPSLEKAFVERITGLKKNSPLCPLAVVTSSRRMSERLQRLLALENGLSLINVSFHTFYSFAVSTAACPAGLSVPLLSDPAFFDRIMNTILDKQISRPFKGFARAVRSSIRDLTDAGVDPEAAIEHLEEGLFGDPKGQERLRWLFEVFGSYKKKLESLPVLSHADLVTRAAESAPASGFLKGFKEIIYYGFYDLTGLQLDFFKAATENYPCSVFYPYVNHPAYSFAKKFFETNLHGAQNQVEELPRKHSNPALEPSLKSLFDPQALPDRGARTAGSVFSIASVSGRRDEIWKAAKEIIRLVEKEGYSYSEIGVVARTLEPYRTAAIEVFDENKIPFEFPAGQPVLSRPTAKIPFSLLKLNRNGFPSEAVADIISFPYFKRGNETDRWGALISRLGITGGWSSWEGMLKSLGPKENLSFGLLEWLEKLKNRLRDLESQKSWQLLARSSLAIIDENFDFKNSPPDDLEAFGAFRESISSMEVFQLIGDSRKGEFLDALEEKMASALLSPKNVSNHGVRVLDAMSARGESFRCLILVGLEEKFFPRLVREDPCLRDSARSALRDREGYWIYPKMEGYEEEKLIFHMLVSSASHRLVCVFQRSDEEGKSVVVSLFLRELARSCGFSIDSPGEVEYVSRRNLDRLKGTAPELLSSKELSIKLSAQGLSPADYLRACFAGRETDEYGFLRKSACFISSKGAAGEYDGQVGEIPDFLEYLKGRKLSPSALETLSACPFKYFLSAVVGLNEPDEPTGKGALPPDVCGRIYHETLKDMYQKIRNTEYGIQNSEGGIDAGEVGKLAEKSFEKTMAGFDQYRSGIYPVVWEVIHKLMLENIIRRVKEDFKELKKTGFVPKYFEEELETEPDLQAGAAAAGSGRIGFHGRIDRIDLNTGETLFRVVDYKKSRRGSSDRLDMLVKNGELFQPPVYAGLAGKLFEKRGIKPDGVYFLSLEDSPETTGKESVQTFSAESCQALNGHVRRMTDFLVSLIEHGRFFIRPGFGRFGHCRWCHFQGACRKNHPASLRRSENSRWFREREGFADREPLPIKK